MKVNSLILQTESYWQREAQKLEVCQNNQKKSHRKKNKEARNWVKTVCFWKLSTTWFDTFDLDNWIAYQKKG